MNHTTNYQLSQWEKSDKVQMEDFNADNAKIDAALATQAAALAAQAAGLALRGNCQMEVRTFVGQSEQENGTHRLAFPVRPALAMVIDSKANIMWINGLQDFPMFLGNLQATLYRLELGSPDFHWEASTAVFTAKMPRSRLDEKDVRYYMFVWYLKDTEITSVEI